MSILRSWFCLAFAAGLLSAQQPAYDLLIKGGHVIDPKNGRPMNDIKFYIDNIPWLTDEDRYKIFEGNARRLFSRLRTPAVFPGK